MTKSVDTGSYHSWGRFPTASQSVTFYKDRHNLLPLDGPPDTTYLPFGNGRSYGDSCLNDGGTLIDCRRLNKILSFDEERGILTAEAGILLADLLQPIMKAGWFLPVTPGTKFVTLGGAIANDIHGKNHHKAGTFGRHVLAFELVRSNSQRWRCSMEENADWFAATIGGMGLTGVITWATLKLKKISSGFIEQDTIRFSSLAEFAALSDSSDNTFDYSVAWLDTAATKAQFGRGLFMRGNHAAETLNGENEMVSPYVPAKSPRALIPFTPAAPLLNRWSIKAFNTLYYHKQFVKQKHMRVPYNSFFYPLDGLKNWPRLYGPQGFVQHQSVLPRSVAEQAIEELLKICRNKGETSFLTVLKAFGDVSSPGLLSFPQPGLTITLDFPFRGKSTLDLLHALDHVVRQAKGAVNPYKDGRMSAVAFQNFFPQWKKLIPFVDPRFSSGFWRRVSAATDA